jgi:hypothetical protein
MSMLVGWLSGGRKRAGLNSPRAHTQRAPEAHTLRILGELAVHHDPASVEQAKEHDHQPITFAEEM